METNRPLVALHSNSVELITDDSAYDSKLRFSLGLNKPFQSCVLPLSQNESNLSYGHVSDLQDNERPSNTHFHMKGCSISI